jgi:hypothetical protein
VRPPRTGHRSSPVLSAGLLVAGLWLALLSATPGLAVCTKYYAEDNPSYGYSAAEDTNLYTAGTLSGHRHVTCSQGYVCVEVWAYTLYNGLGEF